MISAEDFKQFDELEQIREIYARFGLCIFQLQVVEQELMNMIIIYAGAHKIAKSQKCFDDIFKANKSKTMGKLFEKMLKEFQICDGDRKCIWFLHKKRNYFAHHYFKDRVTEWHSEQGRLKMLAEIQELIDLSECVDKKLEEYAQPYMDRMKITADMLNQIQTEYMNGTRNLDHMLYDE